MLRGPTAGSGDTTSGDPDPFRTVERALADELNLHAARDYDSADIGCIGYYLDRTRAQPFSRVPAPFGPLNAGVGV
jgi:hypothetical protein